MSLRFSTVGFLAFALLVHDLPAAESKTVLLDSLEAPLAVPEGGSKRIADAHALASQGLADDAIAMIDAAMEEEGASFHALELKGVIEATTGRLDEAILSLTAAAELSPQSASVFRMLGDVYSAKGDTDRAYRMFRQAFDLDPDDRKTNQRLGLIYRERGAHGDAVAYLERGLKGPARKNLELALPLAQSWVALNKPVEARDALLAALDLKSENAAAHRILGAAAYAAKDWQLADERLTRARSLGDLDPQIAAMAADARRELGDFESATQLFEVLLGEEGRRPALVRSLGITALESGDLDRAFDLFKELVRGEDATLQDHLALGQVATASEQFSIAAEQYNAVIRIAPDQPDGYLRLANLAAGVRDYDGALRVLDGGLQRLPEQTDLVRRKVLVLLRLDRLSEARELAEAVWVSDDARTEDGIMLASLSKALGNPDAAEEIYKTVLFRHPDTVGALAGLALLAAERGEFEAAEGPAGKAFAIGPENPMAAYAQGWVLSQSDVTRSDGIALLERAAQALVDPRILLLVAEAHASSGDQQAASRAARAALELSHSFPGADKARALSR